MPYPQIYNSTQTSTRAADLLPVRLNSASASNASPSPPSVTAKPKPGEGKIPFGKGKKSFSVGLGSLVEDPTALQGHNRDRIVSTRQQLTTNLPINPYLQQRIGTNQRLLLETLIDPEALAADFSYTIAPKFLPGAFSVNIFNQRSPAPVFREGDRHVYLPHEIAPWVHRLGGGIEYFQPLTPKLDAALGLSYQRVSVRERMFTSQIQPVDQFGNQVTFSDTGQDDLLTLDFAALYSTVDNLDYPTRGSKVRFGIDQSMPVGVASILFTRFSANCTRFIPLNLFGFKPGSRTLVLNFQAGTMINDVPPYEAYTLGGSNSVRGFAQGNVGSGRSFIQTTAEYRFPIFSFIFRKQAIDVGGVLFVDYGTDLGTGNEVTGKPSVVRDKPGDGLGYGAGFHLRTPFVGLVRFELGLNNRGGSELHVELGERF